MNEKYLKWIEKNIPNYESAYGKCRETCEKMLKEFPELKLVRGYYSCAVWGERMHWWLVDAENNIIDPTAIQFPTKGNGIYQKLDEFAPQPTGKCTNCGEYIYNGNYLCSDGCKFDSNSEINE
jgi:hypothetical protein